MTESFDIWMRSIQSCVEKKLSELLPSENRTPQRLHEAMRYAVLDGGKRIRPLLVFAEQEHCSVPKIHRYGTGCSAVEMIHAYSLIHDTCRV